MTFCLPPVLDELVLPAAALRAAVLDGELYPVGDGYRTIDLPLDPASRALSLRALTTHGRVIAGATAAWVWGVVPELSSPRATIVSPTAPVGHSAAAQDPGVRSRIARLEAMDVATPGGVRVTSPWRTAIDLVCAESDAAGDDVVRALIALAGATLEDVRADLDTRSRLRGRKRGAMRLQVLVTR